MSERRINDIVIRQPIHRQKAEVIYPLACNANRLKGSIIVCLGGESGVGKSEVAEELSDMFMQDGKSCSIIKLDAHYKIPPLLRCMHRTQHFEVGVEEISWVSVYNSVADTVEGGTEVVIVEGLYALNSVGTLKVYLEGSVQETEGFRKLRKKENIDSLRTRVLEAEHKVVVGLKDKADVTVTFDGNIK